jgi:hypothetical protein
MHSKDLHVAAVHNHDRYDAEKTDAGKKIGWALSEFCHPRMLGPTLGAGDDLLVQSIAK